MHQSRPHPIGQARHVARTVGADHHGGPVARMLLAGQYHGHVSVRSSVAVAVYQMSRRGREHVSRIGRRLVRCPISLQLVKGQGSVSGLGQGRRALAQHPKVSGVG